MILCVNPNPAIDKTLVIDGFRLNHIHRPSLELALPGGKGCNVARAAKTLGQQAVVTGWVGGHAGDFIEAGLRAEGIQAAFVRSAAESRSCLSIIDPTGGSLTEIYEKGRPVSPGELEEFYGLFHHLLPAARMVTLSGSLPPGVPPDFYARLIELAARHNLPCLLDSSGEALRAGWQQAHPAVLKCNRDELSELLGQPLESLEELKQALRSLAADRPARVVVTLGAAGALAAEGQHLWLAQPPRIQAVSAVGSGDAFLAGLACGLLEQQPLPDALRLAMAAGAANTLQPGAGRFELADVEHLLPQVRLDKAL